MMKSEIFQNIFDMLDKYLYSGWQKLVVSLEFGNDVHSVCFYEKIDGIYYSCFDIQDIDEDNMFEDFETIFDLVNDERKTRQSKWTNMTMTVDSNGNMNVDFEYDDIMSNILEYRAKWKKKYLN